MRISFAALLAFGLSLPLAALGKEVATSHAETPAVAVAAAEAGEVGGTILVVLLAAGAVVWLAPIAREQVALLRSSLWG